MEKTWRKRGKDYDYDYDYDYDLFSLANTYISTYHAIESQGQNKTDKSELLAIRL